MVYKIKQPEVIQKFVSNSSFFGIDPGVNGAIVCYTPSSKKLEFFDIPTNQRKVGKFIRNEVDCDELVKIFKNFRNISYAFIEQVQPYPNRGMANTFNFVVCYGVIIGILAAKSIPIKKVPSRIWKSEIGLKTKKIKKKEFTTELSLKNHIKNKAKLYSLNKDIARNRASKEFPDYKDYFKRKKDDGRAEAALIALWGAKKSNTQENNN